MKKSNPAALLPIGVFLVMYLGLGISFEYVMGIPMGFYNIPIVVAFLVAILVACVQNRTASFDQKLEWMAQGLADRNIITMILIFMAAGIFVGVVGRSGAESVAYFVLSIVPAKYSVAVLFVAILLCIYRDGNLCGNDFADHADRGSCLSGIRFFSSAVCGICHGRRDVR